MRWPPQSSTVICLLPAAGHRAPIELPNITLLMPTRRATRALQEAFLRAGRGRAMLLPKIIAIAEGQEDLTLLSGIASLDTLATGAENVPPAVSNMERLLVLTQLVMRWSDAMAKAKTDAIGGMQAHAGAGSETPAQAAHLATELARLMDMVETENVSLDALDTLVPEEFAEHWQHTLNFLRIVTEFWPIHLNERGYASPAARRNALLLAEAHRYATTPPKGPVIVAGVTGSIPATVKLMQAVANLPNGAIVLPGLDLALDEASWNAISPADTNAPRHPEHPQYGLKKLIEGLGLSRSDIGLLPGTVASTAGDARTRLISEAMRPASTTERWHEFIADASNDIASIASGLDGVSLIEAPTQQDEAEAIALILREAVETPGRTAALVSPDRLLARRVATRLQAWGITVDDSAGRPFAKTVPGAFLDLIIEAVAKDFAPPELMALLKHPLTRLGLDPFAVRRAGRALELAAFRTAYLGRGLDGVEQALERAQADIRNRSAAASTPAPSLRARATKPTWPASAIPPSAACSKTTGSAPAILSPACASPSRRWSTPTPSAAVIRCAFTPRPTLTLPKPWHAHRTPRPQAKRPPPRPSGPAKPATPRWRSSPACSTPTCRARRSKPPITPISTAASSPARTCARACPCIPACRSGARSKHACSRPTS